MVIKPIVNTEAIARRAVPARGFNSLRASGSVPFCHFGPQFKSGCDSSFSFFALHY